MLTVKSNLVIGLECCMRILPIALLIAVSFSPASTSRAEKAAELKPALAATGKPVLEERFEASQLSADWAVAKGTWQPKDGSLVGQEKPADMHAAVITLKKPLKNAGVRFSFKLNGATNFNLSFNHAQGHLFRILVAEDGLTLTKDKNKTDPNSKPQPLAKAEGKFPASQWHTLLVEIDGANVSVQADNGAKLTASHPELATLKTGYRFVTKGQSLLLDDLTIWQGK